MVGAKIGGFFNHFILCFFMQIPFGFESILCIDSEQELPLGFAKVNQQNGQNLMSFLPSSSTKNAVIKIISIGAKILIISFITNTYAGGDDLKNRRFDLLLAGGGLKTCSSMASHNCTKNIFDSNSKSTNLYQISQSNLTKFNNSLGFLTLLTPQKMQINKVISNIYAESPEAIVTRQALRDLFANQQALTLYQSLSDAVFYALLDSFEYAQTTRDGKRKRESVKLEYNKNKASLAIYQRFVQQATLRKPPTQKRARIALITASSRDPFEVADFYESVFTEAGADVIWLPLDGTYQQARALEELGQTGCQHLSQIRARNHSYYREDIYPQRTAQQREFCAQPEKMLSALAGVQGVFFNGGDQSLTLAALKDANGLDTPELSLIRQQMQAGQLIVGGTSAGTAVQAGGIFAQMPVPMITNGDPSVAMQRGAFGHPPPSQRCGKGQQCAEGILADDLTYSAKGGTGLFNLGLLDTHFSERERETRLVIFAAETKQRFAFGVDETSALLVGKGPQVEQLHFEVVGQNGVFIIDRQQGVYARDSRVKETGEQVVVSGLSHYLATGSVARFKPEQGEFTFQLAGKPQSTINTLQALQQGHWRDQTRLNCGSTAAIKWSQFANHYSLTPQANTLFYYEAQGEHCSYINLPFTIFDS